MGAEDRSRKSEARRKTGRPRGLLLGLALLVCFLSQAAESVAAEGRWVTFEGGPGPGNGRHVVFVTGDEEYRSEESMPMLAKILAVRHGFRCTVLFAIDEQTGEINPQILDNVPGLEALDRADLMVLFLRFRELPDAQMKHIVDYLNSGRPIIGLRTATHSFAYRQHKDSAYAKYDYQNELFKGGFGRQVLGETWIDHYGQHQKESTRGIIAAGLADHPIVRGVGEIWGPSDVYALTTLPADCRPLIMGQVLAGMDPNDKPNPNKPPVPVAWTRSYTGDSGKTARVFATTMGHAGDFQDEDFRRLLVNACYWCLDMADRIPARSHVDLVGTYRPNPIGYGGHNKGMRPADHAIPMQE
jgi:type 1 glutamine amidotransferase